jgi:hypothetical protein
MLGPSQAAAGEQKFAVKAYCWLEPARSVPDIVGMITSEEVVIS